MNLFVLEDTDKLRRPWMFKLSNDSLWSAKRQTNSYNWFNITRFPRLNQWAMVVLNAGFVTVFDALGVGLALPVWTNTFSWWILLPVVVITYFFGRNTIKLYNYLRGKGGHDW